MSDGALAGMVGLGLLAAVLCGFVCCRSQGREGLFERLLAKVTKAMPSTIPLSKSICSRRRAV